MNAYSLPIEKLFLISASNTINKVYDVQIIAKGNYALT